MDPVTLMAIAGGASQGASNLVNTGVNIWSQKDQQAFNSAEAQKARDWQTEMSNTAYQRSVADMEAAGINPNLLAGGGGQASSSAGAVASGSAAARGSFDFSSIFSNAIASLIAKDKISSSELIQEMKAESAMDVAQFKNRAKWLLEDKKRSMGHKSYRERKNYEYYD